MIVKHEDLHLFFLFVEPERSHVKEAPTINQDDAANLSKLSSKKVQFYSIRAFAALRSSVHWRTLVSERIASHLNAVKAST